MAHRVAAEEYRVESSPQLLARLGSVLYLIIIAIGLFGEVFVRGTVVVSGDAAATAHNLESMESLWRLGIAGELILLTCGVALSAILYLLLRPVSRNLALVGLLFTMVSLAVEAASSLYLLMALFPLGQAAYLRAFEPEQLNAMVSLAVRSHAHGFGVALIFFGWYCLIAGFMIYRSGYLPKAIGVLMQLAGACYVINSFALILAPAVAAQLFPTILIPAFVGETSLALWLLVKGVNVEKWKRRR